MSLDDQLPTSGVDCYVVPNGQQSTAQEPRDSAYCCRGWSGHLYPRRDRCLSNPVVRHLFNYAEHRNVDRSDKAAMRPRVYRSGKMGHDVSLCHSELSSLRRQLRIAINFCIPPVSATSGDFPAMTGIDRRRTHPKNSYWSAQP
jgi:hypothetical protein